MQTPQAFGRRFQIDVRVEHEVTAIDTAQQRVTVRTADGREYNETYDKLLLSPGASPVVPPLAGPANRLARIVADNMVLGDVTKYEGAIGTSIAKVFDLTVAATGLPAKRLKQMEIPYLSATIHNGSHADYYPGASQMDIKITFSPSDGRLYGAQIVGYDGVDTRIDQFALAIKQGATVEQLTRLEHAYAPPFSSAKDPVAIAGYVAGNILSGKMDPLYWREMQQVDTSKVTLVDVRTSDEYSLGSIPGAVNIPLDDLRSRMVEIPTDRPVWLFCGVGLRGYLASNILKGNGYKEVRNLIGGLKTYKTAIAKIETPTGFDTPCCETASCCSPSSVCEKTRIKVDACGIQCPGPILKMKQAMESLQAGQLLQVRATDAGFPRDA